MKNVTGPPKNLLSVVGQLHVHRNRRDLFVVGTCTTIRRNLKNGQDKSRQKRRQGRLTSGDDHAEGQK